MVDTDGKYTIGGKPNSNFQVSITQQNSIINNNINYAVEAFKIKQGFLILWPCQIMEMRVRMKTCLLQIRFFWVFIFRSFFK